MWLRCANRARKPGRGNLSRSRSLWLMVALLLGGSAMALPVDGERAAAVARLFLHRRSRTRGQWHRRQQRTQLQYGSKHYRGDRARQQRVGGAVHRRAVGYGGWHGERWRHLYGGRDGDPDGHTGGRLPLRTMERRRAVEPAHAAVGRQWAT